MAYRSPVGTLSVAIRGGCLLVQTRCAEDQLEAAVEHYRKVSPLIETMQWFCANAEHLGVLQYPQGPVNVFRQTRITYTRNEHGHWMRLHSSELEDGCPFVMSKEQQIADMQKEISGEQEGFDA